MKAFFQINLAICLKINEIVLKNCKIIWGIINYPYIKLGFTFNIENKTLLHLKI